MKKKLKVKKAALGKFFGRRPGMQQQQPIKNLSNMGPINVSPFNSTPIGVRGGVGPLPNALGAMQQAAPTQPVPAMKKGGMSKKKMQDGGMVRGQGAAIKGLKKVRIY